MSGEKSKSVQDDELERLLGARPADMGFVERTNQLRLQVRADAAELAALRAQVSRLTASVEGLRKWSCDARMMIDTIGNNPHFKGKYPRTSDTLRNLIAIYDADALAPPQPVAKEK
jgi:hypothetical protein